MRISFQVAVAVDYTIKRSASFIVNSNTPKTLRKPRLQGWVMGILSFED
jgi:hypothetical protein